MKVIILSAILFSLSLSSSLVAAVQDGQGSRPANRARPTTAILCVLNKSDATAQLLDAQSGKELALVKVGDGPHEAAASPDGAFIVACNYGGRRPGSSLTVIDCKKLKSIRTIQLKGYHRPHGIQFLPDGKHLVVTAETERKLLVIDFASGKVTAAIDTAQDVSHMVALSPNGKRAYVANIRSGSVSVLDLEKGERIKNIETGAGAEGIAAHPTRPEVWITNRAADSVSVLDTNKLVITKTIVCGKFPIRVAFNKSGTFALVTCPRSGDIAVIDVESRKEIRRIDMGRGKQDDGEKRLFRGQFPPGSPAPIGILVAGSRAFVANTFADQISVVDLSTFKVIARWKTGKQPDGMAYALLRTRNENLYK